MNQENFEKITEDAQAEVDAQYRNSLVKTLAKIQKELKAPKNQHNKFADFYYRSCEDILEAVKPLLNGAVLVISDDLINFNERYYVKATATLRANGDEISATAYARETETKKGMDPAQITGSASSYARKYALNGLFLIDDNKDPDTRDNTKKGSTKIQKKTGTTQSPATAPQINKIMSMAYAMWPKEDKPEVTLRAQAIIDWFAGHKPLTKWQASDLISTWPEAVKQFDLASNNTPDDYRTGIEPPPITEDDIPY